MQLQLGGPRPSHRVASVQSHRVCMPDSFLSHAVHILPVVCAHVFEAFPATCFSNPGTAVHRVRQDNSPSQQHRYLQLRWAASHALAA